MTQRAKINERRIKVTEYLLQGYSEIKIADILGISRETIQRDVKFLREESIKYLRMFPTQEYLFLYKLSVDKLQSYELQLNQLKEDASTENKIRIIRELHKNIDLQVKMLASPMLAHIKYLLKRIEEQFEQLETIQLPNHSIRHRNRDPREMS